MKILYLQGLYVSGLTTAIKPNIDLPKGCYIISIRHMLLAGCKSENIQVEANYYLPNLTTQPTSIPSVKLSIPTPHNETLDVAA